ncbi:MAG: hypothetical protein ABI671_22040 [Burkholderiales bacterium]
MLTASHRECSAEHLEVEIWFVGCERMRQSNDWWPYTSAPVPANNQFAPHRVASALSSFFEATHHVPDATGKSIAGQPGSTENL